MILRIDRRCAVVALVAVLSVGSNAFAQKKDEKKEKKLNGQQQAELQQLSGLVDSAMNGKAAPADIEVAWHNDFLKALEGKTYVPFTLTAADSKLGTTPLTLYLRVAPKGAPGPTPQPRAMPGEESQPKKDEAKPAAYPFEDLHFFPKVSGGAPTWRVERAFAVPAGEYDVYLAFRDHPDKNAGPQRTSIVKREVTVPDFWANELATSTIILAEKIEPLKEPLSADQQAERPYALGAVEIQPALETNLTQKDELSIMFLIYNPGLGADKKPDLNVDYSFHVKTGETEKYFNKTSPQTFNAASLPAQFDLAAGHQLVAGQSIPLTSFPPGDYRLEIKVLDKVTGKSLVKNLMFNVAS